MLYRRRKSGVQGVRCCVGRIGCVCCGEDVNVSKVVCLGFWVADVLDGDGMGWEGQGEAEGGKMDGERRNGVGMGAGMGRTGREVSGQIDGGKAGLTGKSGKD